MKRCTSVVMHHWHHQHWHRHILPRKKVLMIYKLIITLIMTFWKTFGSHWALRLIIIDKRIKKNHSEYCENSNSSHHVTGTISTWPSAQGSVLDCPKPVLGGTVPKTRLNPAFYCPKLSKTAPNRPKLSETSNWVQICQINTWIDIKSVRFKLSNAYTI